MSYFKESKASELRLRKRKKEKKGGYLSRISLPGPVRQEPQSLFSLKFETDPYFEIVF